MIKTLKVKNSLLKLMWLKLLKLRPFPSAILVKIMWLKVLKLRPFPSAIWSIVRSVPITKYAYCYLIHTKQFQNVKNIIVQFSQKSLYNYNCAMLYCRFSGRQYIWISTNLTVVDKDEHYFGQFQRRHMLHSFLIEIALPDVCTLNGNTCLSIECHIKWYPNMEFIITSPPRCICVFTSMKLLVVCLLNSKKHNNHYWQDMLINL